MFLLEVVSDLGQSHGEACLHHWSHSCVFQLQFSDSVAKTFGILFSGDDWQLQYLGSLHQLLCVADNLIKLEYRGSELLLHVADEEGGRCW